MDAGESKYAFRNQSWFHLNVRSELLFLLAINGVLIGNVKAIVVWALVLFAGILLAFAKRYEIAAKYVATYGIMWGMEQLLMLLPQNMVCNFIIVVSSVLRRFIPFFMVGSLILETTTVGMFMASMDRMHLPKALSIPIAVILRFLPTVKEEWNSIQEAMKLRGIGLSFGNVLMHPVKTIEYILVPLLSSSIKIGDELSAASVARGLGMERQRSTVYDADFCVWDYLLFAAAVVFFLLTTFL